MAIRDQQKIWWWTRLEDLFKRYCMRWLELLIARDQLAPVDLQHQDIRSILVVRQHDQLGDFLVSIPALYALREQYPHAEISLLVREYFADVARCIPCIDEVIVFQEDARRWRLRKIIAFLRQLRRRRNLAIVLTTVSHSLTSDLLAHWSRAEYVLGSADRVFSGCRRNFLYNLNAPSRPLPRHQTQRNLDIVRYLGIEVDRVVGAIVVPDSTVDEARGFLRGRGPEPSLPIVGMHLGAGKPENRWPVESFAELARQVRTKYNATIALFWGPGEEGLCDAFSRQIAFEPIRVGHPSLLNLAAVFRLCSVLVCNDTGIMHLGAAAGIPVVALFGPTDPEEWKPLTPSCTAVYSQDGLIGNINVESVLTTLGKILSPPVQEERPSL